MYLCIDIGATKTALALFSPHGLRFRLRRFKTSHTPEQFEKSLCKSLSSILPSIPFPLPLKSVIIAYPGPVQKNRPYRAPNLPEWDHFDLSLSVEKCIKNLLKNNRGGGKMPPLHFLNDADAATIYEARGKKGKSIYLTLSTGIGGGIAEDGHLTIASQKFEPGHNIYLYKNEQKEWEDIAAASSIKKIYGRSVTTLRDPEIFDDIAARLSLGLVEIIKTEHPTTIILGGPLALTIPYFIRPLTRLLHQTLGKNAKLPHIVRARRPLEAVIYGCYLYGKSH